MACAIAQRIAILSGGHDRVVDDRCKITIIVVIEDSLRRISIGTPVVIGGINVHNTAALQIKPHLLVEVAVAEPIVMEGDRAT